jgi:hypothetical protein
MHSLWIDWCSYHIVAFVISFELDFDLHGIFLAFLNV